MSQQVEVRVGAGGGAGHEQVPQVTYSQQVPPDASQRIPLQQHHLQMSQGAQGGWQAGGDGWRREETGGDGSSCECAHVHLQRWQQQ